jgi:hypothetical protein
LAQLKDTNPVYSGIRIQLRRVRPGQKAENAVLAGFFFFEQGRGLEDPRAFVPLNVAATIFARKYFRLSP